MIASGIQFALMDTAVILSQLPRESLDAMRDVGLDPAMFTSVGWVLGVSAFCCVVGMVIAAVLGAIGGAIFAAVQSE
jgi:membrane associated rhomboid family serine protease